MDAFIVPELPGAPTDPRKLDHAALWGESKPEDRSLYARPAAARKTPRFAEFPTTTPEETIGHIVDFFRLREPVAAIGIASFGPIDPNPALAHLWLHHLHAEARLEELRFCGHRSAGAGDTDRFDTDVNAAALAESRWGAAHGLRSFLYVTVGTGLGGGALVDGRLLHGRLHPEMGHIRVPHDRATRSVSRQLPLSRRLSGGTCRGPGH